MRQLGALQGPLACRQATRLPEEQCNEDSDSQGTQVAQYWESFSRFSSEFFTYDVRQRFFHDWFLVGETPHISVQLHLAYDLRTATLWLHCVSRVCTLSSLVNHPPKGEGYCDTAVRKGTSDTGSVHQYSRNWFSTYSVRTYSWSTSHSSSGVCFLHSGDCFVQFHIFMFHFHLW